MSAISFLSSILDSMPSVANLNIFDETCVYLKNITAKAMQVVNHRYADARMLIKAGISFYSGTLLNDADLQRRTGRFRTTLYDPRSTGEEIKALFEELS